jgi:hypothetical protein
MGVAPRLASHPEKVLARPHLDREQVLVVTGNFLVAITLSLLEPTVQAFAFFFHEKAWQRWGSQRAAAPVATGA